MPGRRSSWSPSFERSFSSRSMSVVYSLVSSEDKNADERYQIDIIEAEISYIEETDTLRGAVSQSAQFAPCTALLVALRCLEKAEL